MLYYLTVAYAVFVVSTFTKFMFTGTYVTDMQAWFALGSLIVITKRTSSLKRYDAK